MDILSKYQEYSLPIYGVILILLLLFFRTVLEQPECEVIYLIGIGEKEEER